jgi:hypothetical protein
MILYMITDLPNASILDTPVPFQELCTGLLDPSTDISSASDRIKLVCPVQLVFWTFTGGACHCRAECCCRNLQPIHADEMPESLSASDQLVTPAVVSWVFAQLIDLSDDGIHTPVIQVETTQSLPGLVSVGASRSLKDGQNSEHTPCIWTGHDALVVVQAGHWRKIGSHAYT